MSGERERVKRALELGRGGGAELRASGVLHPCSGICCLLPRVKWSGCAELSLSSWEG